MMILDKDSQELGFSADHFKLAEGPKIKYAGKHYPKDLGNTKPMQSVAHQPVEPQIQVTTKPGKHDPVKIKNSFNQGSSFSMNNTKPTTISRSGAVLNQMGEPLSDAHLRVVNSSGQFKFVAVTDHLGTFELTTLSSDLVEVSHVGYKSVVVPVYDIEYVIELQEETELLDEIVITTTNPPKKKSNTLMYLGLSVLGLFLLSKKKNKDNKGLKGVNVTI